MIPLFVSDYSIGRSILKITPPKELVEGGPSYILDLALEAGLDEVFLVEDSMIGFLESHKTFSKAGIKLRFGVRFNMCNDVTKENQKNSSYKIIVFARNDDGCRTLYNLFSLAHVNNGGYLDPFLLDRNFNDDLLIAHPFYDSFIFHNTMYFKNCVYFPVSCEEHYFVEDNGLPFDPIIKSKLPDPKVNTKTILYHYREDAEACQVYRIACNRGFGRPRTLSAPNIEHFGSREFCFQSYMEKAHGRPA